MPMTLHTLFFHLGQNSQNLQFLEDFYLSFVASYIDLNIRLSNFLKLKTRKGTTVGAGFRLIPRKRLIPVLLATINAANPYINESNGKIYPAFSDTRSFLTRRLSIHSTNLPIS